jgi:hypothetical protein
VSELHYIRTAHRSSWPPVDSGEHTPTLALTCALICLRKGALNVQQHALKSARVDIMLCLSEKMVVMSFHPQPFIPEL